MRRSNDFEDLQMGDTCNSKWVRHKELPGEYTDGETPDPIPNSEAKLVRPMVVLRGESRYRQDYEGRFRKKPALSFFTP